MRNSHLASGIVELQDEVGFPSTASDFSRLERGQTLPRQADARRRVHREVSSACTWSCRHESQVLYRQKKQQANKRPRRPIAAAPLFERAPRAV